MCLVVFLFCFVFLFFCCVLVIVSIIIPDCNKVCDISYVSSYCLLVIATIIVFYCNKFGDSSYVSLILCSCQRNYYLFLLVTNFVTFSYVLLVIVTMFVTDCNTHCIFYSPYFQDLIMIFQLVMTQIQIIFVQFQCVNIRVTFLSTCYIHRWHFLEVQILGHSVISFFIRQG